jgi:hypothetical protein
MITGIYASKEGCINDTIVRADCKQIGLHSGLNERKSSFDWLRVTYPKVNFGLGPNNLRVESGKILKFRPVQTSMSMSDYLHAPAAFLRGKSSIACVRNCVGAKRIASFGSGMYAIWRESQEHTTLRPGYGRHLRKIGETATRRVRND